MTKAQERRFTTVLLKKEKGLQGDIEARQAVLAVEYVGDPAERVQQLAERELVAREVDQLSAVLKCVRGALRELREGTFGICAACGDPIPRKRLDLVPWSPYCVRCQDQAERGGEDDEAADGADSLRARLVA